MFIPQDSPKTIGHAGRSGYPGVGSEGVASYASSSADIRFLFGLFLFLAAAHSGFADIQVKQYFPVRNEAHPVRHYSRSALELFCHPALCLFSI